MESIAHFYREINSGFLNKSCDQGFEISYLAEYDENDQPQRFQNGATAKSSGKRTAEKGFKRCLTFKRAGDQGIF